VVIAAGRASRPGAWLPEIEPPTDEELESCPFCGGREDRTPPEVLRLGDDPWLVRVVPNLYPAFERQEVVIHTAEHVRTFGELDDEHVEAVGAAWDSRAAEGTPYAFLNEGRLAGASLPHSHSQLVWLSRPPVAVANEDQTRIPELLDRRDLLISERDGIVAVAHPAGTPYEGLIAARDGNEHTAEMLFSVRDLVRRLHGAEGRYPWNAWFHPGDHAHVHFVPRLTALASLELGAGLYVNVVPPEEAAAKLRAVAV
jgi:UDPglucose--hexose-1-phosphate uridylyltransferase